MTTQHSANPSAALVSLAMLKVQEDHYQRDFIQFFVPFVVEVLRDAGHACGPAEIQQRVLDRFGISLPQGAANTVAHRAVRHDLAERDHGAYLLTGKARADESFSVLRDEALKQEARAVDLLRAYALRELKVSWSLEEAEAALLTFLSQRSVPLLAEALNSGILRAPASVVPNAEYIVASFLTDLWAGDREAFECVEIVLKGSILANCLFFPELGHIQQRFDRLDVFVDTPLILRGLGAHGFESQAAIRELLEMLYGLGVSLKCFRQTFEETLGVLDATKATMASETAIRASYGGLLQTLLEAGRTPSDVALMSATLVKTFTALRIEVVERPPHTVPLTVDEAAFETVLQDSIGYRREDTMRHDLDSLTAIHRLRRGELQPTLEAARAIFVTTNNLLVVASRRFFNDIRRQGGVPLCLADHQLATLAWLKQPEIASDLPRKFVIADSYAALNPPAPVWRAYLEEIARLESAGDISTDDYFLLRFSGAAKATLMDLTGGRRDAVSAPTVREVLARTQARIRAEGDAAAQGALDVSAEAIGRASVAERRQAAEREFRNAQYQYIGTISAQRILRAFAAVGMLITLVGTWWAISGLLGNGSSVPVHYVVLGAAAIFVLLLCALKLRLPPTAPLVAAIRALELRMSASIEDRLRTRFERSEHDSEGVDQHAS